MVTEQTTSVWDIVNIIASILGILSSIVTIVTALKMKRYAKRIIQTYSSESLVIANEKLGQAKDLFLNLRSIKFGKVRGMTKERIQNGFSEIESLLDQAENKTPHEKSTLKESIRNCKMKLNDCVIDSDNNYNFIFLGTEIDNSRKKFQAEIIKERKETIKNLK